MDGRPQSSPAGADKPVPQVYLNGRFIPRSQAHIDIEDRGFIFADGVYEVIRYYWGNAFAMDRHVARMTRSLQQVRIAAADALSNMAAISDELVTRNQLPNASVYWQITRGSAPRNHVIPEGIQPTVMAIAYPAHDLQVDGKLRSVSASLHPDTRWDRCDIKSLMLLANVLAKAQAHDAGDHEAILHRDGLVTEGSSTSVLAVRDGQLWTHPANHRILDSITRRLILDLARANGLVVVEQALTIEQLLQAQEVMIAGTTTHVAAVTKVDQQPIGDGRPGKISEILFEGLKKMIGNTCGS